MSDATLGGMAEHERHHRYVTWREFETAEHERHREFETLRKALGRAQAEIRRLAKAVEELQHPPASAAVRAIIQLGGNTMPGTIDVDTTNETVTVQFVDDKDNPTSAPQGAQASFSSSDASVASVTQDPSNPLQGDVTPLAPGTVQLAVSFNGTALEADGTTPIPDPTPVSVQVNPGAAAGERLVLSV